MGELVCALLWNLASGGSGGRRRVIMCVIHTPSSRMWTCFSHVILLATGGTSVPPSLFLQPPPSLPPSISTCLPPSCLGCSS